MLKRLLNSPQGLAPQGRLIGWCARLCSVTARWTGVEREAMAAAWARGGPGHLSDPFGRGRFVWSGPHLALETELTRSTDAADHMAGVKTLAPAPAQKAA